MNVSVFILFLNNHLEMCFQIVNAVQLVECLASRCKPLGLVPSAHNQSWRCMPVIPACQRKRQADQEFKAIPNYI